MDYTIIGSGSQGNCVRIGRTMVDIGLSYAKVKDQLYLVDTLLITHRHTDHVRKSTFERMRREFPNITVVGNWEVATKYSVDIVCNAGYPVEVNGLVYTPFEGVHNALCYGYTWTTEDGEDVIYATDMRSFAGSPEDGRYDYMFLESNHDIHKLNAAAGAGGFGYDAYGAGIMHCSTQSCLAFYYTHRKSPESELVELHKSSRFY